MLEREAQAEAYQFAFIPFFIIFAIGEICYIILQFYFEKDTKVVDEAIALQSGAIEDKEDIEAPVQEINETS